jgi:hypothetical protein
VATWAEPIRSKKLGPKGKKVWLGPWTTLCGDQCRDASAAAPTPFGAHPRHFHQHTGYCRMARAPERQRAAATRCRHVSRRRPDEAIVNSKGRRASLPASAVLAPPRDGPPSGHRPILPSNRRKGSCKCESYGWRRPSCAAQSLLLRPHAQRARQAHVTCHRRPPGSGTRHPGRR